MSNAPNVAFDCIYSDGSGAPAIVSYEGYRFAMDYLGEIRLTNLASGRPSKRVTAAARLAYSNELRKRAGSDWFAVNSAMYA